MGCNHGKTSQPTAQYQPKLAKNTTNHAVGSEDAVKSPLLLGSEDKSSIKEATFSIEASMKTHPPSPREHETDLHEMVAGSTSPEPESEMAASPRPQDNGHGAPPAGEAQAMVSVIKVGARVEAKHDGCWYLGTVTRVSAEKDGVYSVQCDVNREGVLMYTSTVRLAQAPPPPPTSAAAAGNSSLQAPVNSAEVARHQDQLAQESELKNAALQNNRSLFPSAALTTGDDVRRAGEAAALKAKSEDGAKSRPEEKQARKEKHMCCC